MAAKAGPPRATTARAGPSRTAKDEWSEVVGAGKCPNCVKDEEACWGNWTAIQRGRKAYDEGLPLKRPPPHTSCSRCLEKKKGCALPATQVMRDSMKGTGSEAAGSVAVTASSSTK